MPSIHVTVPAKHQTYEVRIGGGLLNGLGAALRNSQSQAARTVAIISNETVLRLYGKRATDSLRRAGFAVKTFQVGDGERHKSFRSLEKIISFLAENGLQRND